MLLWLSLGYTLLAAFGLGETQRDAFRDGGTRAKGQCASQFEAEMRDGAWVCGEGRARGKPSFDALLPRSWLWVAKGRSEDNFDVCCWSLRRREVARWTRDAKPRTCERLGAVEKASSKWLGYRPGGR